MLTREKKKRVRGDYKRSWMTDEYCDLIVWYEPGNAIHGFQLCYGKPYLEHALTWMVDRGFSHMEVDPGEGGGGETAAWKATPILLPNGFFPAKEVMREFQQRSSELPKALRNFIMAKVKLFVARRKT